MNAVIGSRIRNVLFYGDTCLMKKDIDQLSKFDVFRVINAVDESELLRRLNSDIIQLVVVDESIGFSRIEGMYKTISDNDLVNIPVAVVINKESLDFRKQLFDIGISTIVQRSYYEDYIIKAIERIERNMHFRDGLRAMSIAVLDDDRLQLAIIRDYFEKNDIYNVDYFSNPVDMLSASKPYDVFLIDLILPNISGEIVMLEMRKKYENSVIIGISSLVENSVVANVLSIGANDYITKPFNEQVFMAKLYSNARVLMLLKENDVKNKILHEMAIKDGMTGLYNHKHIQETMQSCVKVAKRYQKSLSVIMFDIDHFKDINDTYGHQFGDKVLIKVAEIISTEVRDVDIAGRYGGEEFITILPETALPSALILAERIRQRVENENFGLKESITISGGVSEYSDDTADLMISRADEMLYLSKANGRNRIEHKQLVLTQKESIG